MARRTDGTDEMNGGAQQPALFAAPPAESPPADSLYGSSGWTTEAGIDRLLGPFAVGRGRSIAPGIRLPGPTGTSATPLPAEGGIARFAGLDAAAAVELLDLLPPGQLGDRQNDGPTLGALLRSAVAHPGVVEVHGYLVVPPRPDERVTGEGVFVYGSFDDVARLEDGAVWAELRTAYGLGDATAPPDELVVRRNRWRPDEPCWRLWWD